ncbi:MAG: hypothetical protein D6742_11840 [Cyanobacteria bacterium J069]|nr:MAG: hypothetical protein D6742_11840 [Cyanobacteria bacterium J069]
MVMIVKPSNRRAIARQSYLRDRQRGRVAVAVAPQPDVLTTKGLDLLSLAVCSCALTLLCHAATSPLQSANSGNSGSVRPPAMSRSAATPSFLPFTLLSPPPEVKEQGEEEE